ncbi:hypothetical protein VKT23_018516 [Stygiomarasmius scandens]|uniref:Cytochrome P450 n=1 Tax=Marasmiellus scandens TaxID=2682957 RepID=A0ABR1IR59_9AGAR
MIPPAVWATLIICISCLWATNRRRLSRLPLPPGPKRYPLIGNAFQMPRYHEFITFTEWRKHWGDYIYLKVFGLEFLVINSYTVAKELLEKRSVNFSDRPRMIMAGEMIGWNTATAITPFNDTFKNHRRLMARAAGGKNAEAFWPVEERERRKFLLHLIEEPNNLIQLIRRLEGSVILEIAYGYPVKRNNDPFVTLAETTMDQFSISTTYGTFMVDIIPAMRYIPEWFPGGGFKKIAREWGSNFHSAVEKPFTYVKEEMTAGKARPSFSAQMLTRGDEKEEFIKGAAFSMYAGGSDTAVAALTIFFYLMIKHPEVQVKAQAEIDSLTHGEYLPTWSDRAKLPYVEAVMLECLRWGPIAPLGFPHRVMAEDEFEGRRIPEGTLCIPNLWAMMHDPNYYTNPDEFIPERFMKSAPELDPRNIVFGFGRRYF